MTSDWQSILSSSLIWFYFPNWPTRKLDSDKQLASNRWKKFQADRSSANIWNYLFCSNCTVGIVARFQLKSELMFIFLGPFERRLQSKIIFLKILIWLKENLCTFKINDLALVWPFYPFFGCGCWDKVSFKNACNWLISLAI